MKRLILYIIRGYQLFLSLGSVLMRAITGMTSACRFQPTCSEYAYQSIHKHGIIRGLRLSVLRILRCNPWGGGGIDRVK